MTVGSQLTDLDGLQGDVETILTDVLSSILREEVLPSFDTPPAGEQAITRLAIHDLAQDSFVAVEVLVPMALARIIAGRMLSVAQPLDDDVVDAVAELGNIAGGNVKAVLFEHSRLSLPAPRFEVSAGEESRHPEGLIVRAAVSGHICELAVFPVANARGVEWPPYDGDGENDHDETDYASDVESAP